MASVEPGTAVDMADSPTTRVFGPPPGLPGGWRAPTLPVWQVPTDRSSWLGTEVSRAAYGHAPILGTGAVRQTRPASLAVRGTGPSDSHPPSWRRARPDGADPAYSQS